MNQKTVIVYHNPRCSKSRETLKLLAAHHIDYELRLYLEDIPNQAEIKQLLSLLGFSSARQLMRVKEHDYKANGLADVDDESLLVDAMVNYPKLIERPIVVTGDKAAITRPPELVLSLLNISA